MLKEMGIALMALVDQEFNHIEFYEGQFESFDEQVVNPPAAYLDFQSGTASQTDEALGTMNVRLYVMTSRVERSSDNMLDLLEDIIEAVHKKALRTTGNVYLGRVFYKGFQNTVVVDGLVVWEVLLEVKRG